jgi:PIN domain nuclease of toxin-antitoxin system
VRILLDAHVWLWWMLDSPRLDDATRTLVLDPESTVYLSAASAWEIAIKYALGKIALPAPPATYIPTRAEGGDFRILDVRLEHAVAVADLPRHHDDPFDRLLVAQSIVEGFRLITADRRLAVYSADIVTL